MRSFTIVKINSSDRRVKSKSVGGRFQSADPASAAKKAGSSICRLNNINSSIKFKVAIKETTQGSANKVFVYSFSRVRNPRTVLRSGKEITYEFETKVKSLKRKSNRQDGLVKNKQKNNSDEYDIYIDALGILDDDEIVPSPRKRPPSPLSPSPRIPKASVLDDEEELLPGNSSLIYPGGDFGDTFNTQLVNKMDPNYAKSEWCRPSVPYYCGDKSAPSKKGRCVRKPQDCNYRGVPSPRGGDTYIYGDLDDDFLYKAMPKEERAKINKNPAGLKSDSRSLIALRNAADKKGGLNRERKRPDSISKYFDDNSSIKSRKANVNDDYGKRRRKSLKKKSQKKRKSKSKSKSRRKNSKRRM